MPYVIPQFPLDVWVWHNQTTYPPTGPPAFEVEGNLCWNRRVAVPSTGGTGLLGVPLFTMTLLVPKLTDLRGRRSGGTSDIVEVPALSGRYYEVIYVDDIGKGFSNEHRAAILLLQKFPIPLP